MRVRLPPTRTRADKKGKSGRRRRKNTENLTWNFIASEMFCIKKTMMMIWMTPLFYVK
jgi:hypothetical protein